MTLYETSYGEDVARVRIVKALSPNILYVEVYAPGRYEHGERFQVWRSQLDELPARRQ